MGYLEGATIIAGLIIILIIIITTTAIIRYPAKDALRIISAMGPIMGIVIGVISTYFFTNKSVQDAKQETEQYKKTVVAIYAQQPTESRAVLLQDPLIFDAYKAYGTQYMLNAGLPIPESAVPGDTAGNVEVGPAAPPLTPAFPAIPTQPPTPARGNGVK